MEPVTIGFTVTGIMLALLMLRIPIAAVLLGSGYVGLALVIAARGSEFSIARGLAAADSYISGLGFSGSASYTFTTIPMFLLMGYLATEGGFTRDIYTTARMWLARVPGGLAVASAAGCALFAAISGSSLATAAAMGRMAVPEMIAHRYNKGLAAGVVAAAGTLGSLIPPSILMILYAVFTEQSIAAMFLAGVIPGFLSLGAYVGMVMLRAKLNPSLAPPVPKVTMSEKLNSLKSTWGMLTLIAVIIAGLYLGFFTPTEAGAIGASVAFLLCLFSGRLSRGTASAALRDTVKTTSLLFAVVVGALMVTTFTALTGIAAELTSWASAYDGSPMFILFGLSVMYIVLGTFLGPIEIMLLTLPIVVPIIKGLDYDLVWFGIIMIKYLEIGLVTPPVGLNVYIMKAVLGGSVKIGEIFSGVSWFIMMDIFTLILLIAFPDIATFLPELMEGRR